MNLWECMKYTYVLLLCQVAISSADETSSNTMINVAFIFAGGVRTFGVPPVHQSIRHNLIHSFCPVSQCSADVFVRLSISDNNHDGFDSKGKIVQANKEKESESIQLLESLRHASINSKLVTEVVNIGSTEESDQMDTLSRKNIKHKIYRTLDSRRYSMNFNRWAAYNLLLKEEHDSKKSYTWIVHARLDMAWGSPIRPCYEWSTAKMWVPDTWYADIPDTFALIPRGKADIFYSLDKKYIPEKIMCLGGPNFDPKTLETDFLRKLGFNPDEITVAQHEDCMTKLDQNVYVVTHESKLNLTWTSAGVSEVMLKRQLNYYDIGLDFKTLGFSSFFTFIVRNPLSLYCFYVEPEKFIPWVKAFQHTTMAMGAGCNNMWDLISSVNDFSYGPNCDLSTYSSKTPLVNTPLSTCLLDKKMTDWNFLPFRIRRKNAFANCLTIVPHPQAPIEPRTQATRMESCVDSIKIRDNEFTADYHQLQLFNMLPLSPVPQRITAWDYVGPLRCLTVVDSYAQLVLSGNKEQAAQQRRFVEFGSCHGDRGDVSQLFRVQLLSPTHSSTRGAHTKATIAGEGRAGELGSGRSAGAGRSLGAVTSSGDATSSRGGRITGSGTGAGTQSSLRGSNPFAPILPERVSVVIRWVGADGALCLVVDAQNSTGSYGGSTAGTPVAQFSNFPFARLDHCYSVGAATNRVAKSSTGTRFSRQAVLVLERSMIKSPTT